MLDPELLEMLACPACVKPAPLTEDAQAAVLKCAGCGRTYVVKEGIVTLFPDGVPVAKDGES